MYVLITAAAVLAAARTARIALRGQEYNVRSPGDIREVIVATVDEGRVYVCRKTRIGQDYESWCGGAYGTTYVPQKGQTAAAIAEALAAKLNLAAQDALHSGARTTAIPQDLTALCAKSAPAEQRFSLTTGETLVVRTAQLREIRRIKPRAKCVLDEAAPAPLDAFAPPSTRPRLVITWETGRLCLGTVQK